MAHTRGPIALSEAGLIEDTVARLKLGSVKLPKPTLDENGKPVAGEIDAKLVKAIFNAIKEETTASIVMGYKVTFTGLCSFVPKVVNGAKAGTTKRNPRTGETTVVKKDEPDTLGYRVGRSSAVTNAFPSLRTNAGKELHAQLYVKPAKTKKPAPAAANGVAATSGRKTAVK